MWCVRERCWCGVEKLHSSGWRSLRLSSPGMGRGDQISYIFFLVSLLTFFFFLTYRILYLPKCTTWQTRSCQPNLWSCEMCLGTNYMCTCSLSPTCTLLNSTVSEFLCPKLLASDNNKCWLVWGCLENKSEFRCPCNILRAIGCRWPLTTGCGCNLIRHHSHCVDNAQGRQYLVVNWVTFPAVRDNQRVHLGSF